MTIKIQAYQKNGIKSDKIEEEFEFCCWEKLKRWLDGFSELHTCKNCHQIWVGEQSKRNKFAKGRLDDGK